jgi:hypothetical protein
MERLYIATAMFIITCISISVASCTNFHVLDINDLKGLDAAEKSFDEEAIDKAN